MEEEIYVLVRNADTGQECWESEKEYRTNPPLGTYIIRDRRKIRGGGTLMIARAGDTDAGKNPARSTSL